MVSSSVTSFCADRNYTCWGEHLIMYIKNFFDSLFMAGMNLEGCEVGKGGSIGFKPEQPSVFHCPNPVHSPREVKSLTTEPSSKWYGFIECKQIRLLPMLELLSQELNQLGLGVCGVSNSVAQRLRLS